MCYPIDHPPEMRKFGNCLDNLGNGLANFAIGIIAWIVPASAGS
jgi:hypothetical protein